MAQHATGNTTRVTVSNIGGISADDITLSAGVTVLSGQNATNRTSLLKALAAAQGSENVSLKGDTTEGSVELTLDGERYQRTIRRVGDSLVFEGECPVDPAHRDVAELFAFLFEQNRARAAIRRGENLRDVVMEPVDTDEIEERIATLQSQREQKERALEELESMRSQLPALREHRDELAAEIDSLEAQIEAKRADIEAAEASVDETQATQEAVDDQLQELRTVQSDLDSTESKIETTEQTIAELESELETTESELSDLPPVDTDELDDIRAELDRLRDAVAEKERMMSELQNIIQFNRELTDGDDMQYPEALTDGADSATEQLVDAADGVVCWTCGSQTSRSNIAETVERLQALHQDLHGERAQLRERIDDLQTRKDDLETAQERRATLEASVDDLEAQLAQNRDRLASLREERDRLQSAVETAESDLAELREQRQGEVLDLHQELNELEIELQRTREEHESVLTEIETVETETDQIETIEADIAALTDDIADLRQQVDTIERDIVDEFNEHMDAILEKLAYDNLERIWLDRQQVSAESGRRTVEESQFTLHIVRTGEDGTAYEDTVAHLSESEREVTGLIFALAGYIVHQVHEKVPFMLVDSLEAIDSARIRQLLEYVESYADNIVVALLAEDAQAVPGRYTMLTRTEN
jgi:DNA repair exonuclease SbcCD ATPase subunit